MHFTNKRFIKVLKENIKTSKEKMGNDANRCSSEEVRVMHNIQEKMSTWLVTKENETLFSPIKVTEGFLIYFVFKWLYLIVQGCKERHLLIVDRSPTSYTLLKSAVNSWSSAYLTYSSISNSWPASALEALSPPHSRTTHWLGFPLHHWLFFLSLFCWFLLNLLGSKSGVNKLFLERAK